MNEINIRLEGLISNEMWSKRKKIHTFFTSLIRLVSPWTSQDPTSSCFVIILYLLDYIVLEIEKCIGYKKNYIYAWEIKRFWFKCFCQNNFIKRLLNVTSRPCNNFLPHTDWRKIAYVGNWSKKFLKFQL